jgi:hypothetical protein
MLGLIEGTDRYETAPSSLGGAFLASHLFFSFLLVRLKKFHYRCSSSDHYPPTDQVSLCLAPSPTIFIYHRVLVAVLTIAGFIITPSSFYAGTRHDSLSLDFPVRRLSKATPSLYLSHEY